MRISVPLCTYVSLIIWRIYIHIYIPRVIVDGQVKASNRQSGHNGKLLLHDLILFSSKLDKSCTGIEFSVQRDVFSIVTEDKKKTLFGDFYPVRINNLHFIGNLKHFSRNQFAELSLWAIRINTTFCYPTTSNGFTTIKLTW